MDTVPIKEWLTGSPVAFRLYGQALGLRAGWHRLRGRPTEADQLLMRAVRASRLASGGGEIDRVRRLVREGCHDERGLLPVARNRLLRAFRQTAEAREVRREFASYPSADRVRIRYPRDDGDPERQGDLILLKRHDPATGEKGVVLVKYTEAMRRFAAMFDLGALAADYMVVVEPSWWGYEDLTFLFYVGADLDVIVESPWRRDFAFIRDLDTNLVPIRVGAGDWIDPALFQPREDDGRSYDLVMVSGWHPVKRHRELFRTLATLRARHGRTLRVALIGYPSVWTREHIEGLMRRHRVQDFCTIFEDITHAEVARIVADSRAYVLLSRREGANRALYEALFCNTPVIVYRHHQGVNTDHIVDRVGVLFESGRLADAIVRTLDGPRTFRPRQWAMENTGYANSTRALNAALRERALRRGLPWTTDIVEKKNGPNLRYATPGLYRAFEVEYRRLASFLLPAA